MRCHDDHHQKECHHDYCWFSSYFADSNRDPWRILSFWFLLQNWPNISPEVILDTRNIKNRPLIDKQFMGIKHSLSRNCTEIKLSFASKCAVEDDTSSITTSASSLCLLPVSMTEPASLPSSLTSKGSFSLDDTIEEEEDCFQWKAGGVLTYERNISHISLTFCSIFVITIIRRE